MKLSRTIKFTLNLFFGSLFHLFFRVYEYSLHIYLSNNISLGGLVGGLYKVFREDNVPAVLRYLRLVSSRVVSRESYIGDKVDVDNPVIQSRVLIVVLKGDSILREGLERVLFGNLL